MTSKEPLRSNINIEEITITKGNPVVAIYLGSKAYRPHTYIVVVNTKIDSNNEIVVDFFSEDKTPLNKTHVIYPICEKLGDLFHGETFINFESLKFKHKTLDELKDVFTIHKILKFGLSE